MDFTTAATYKSFSGIKLTPTDETHSEAIADYFKKRNRTTMLLSVLYMIWSTVLLFLPSAYLPFLTITNAIFLLVMLVKRNSFDRKEQNRKKTIFSLAVLKCFVEVVILLCTIYAHHKKELLWSTTFGVLVTITAIFEIVYLIGGIYILQYTKDILHILDLDFYDKEWSSYFQIGKP